MLPVDDVLPALQAALAAHPAAVLVAPPGAGKTTRVPLALLDAPWLRGRRIVMLEPRRLAARAAARRLASALGEGVGETVGFRIRGETRVGKRTRLEVVTEGVLARLLHDDPALGGDEPGGVGLVIFDEFHERSLHADLGLALALDAQAHLRPALRLLVMSATLDGARVAGVLGEGTPVVTSEGRAFPVETRWLGRPEGRVEDALAAAVRTALHDEPGDVLAFLPGTAEIRRTATLLDGTLGPGVRLAPLYGDLPPEAQDAALAPSPPGARKVVLATSIAETSLTIEGVRTVVDSGLARRPRFSPQSGMARLETVRVSQAAAEQRRGRAGRTAPGACYRLWSPSEHAALAPYDAPEILLADLAPLALDLARWGAAPDGLRWLDPPPAEAFALAQDTLRGLGALGPEGRITPHGHVLARTPLHPRLAHLLAEARARGLGRLGAETAALLAECDVLRPHGAAPADVDLRLRVEALRGAGSEAFRGLTVDRGALTRVRAEARRLGDEGGKGNGRGAQDDADAAGLLLALAYPERLAERVAEGPGGVRYRLRTGHPALLDKAQPLADAPFLALGALDWRPGGARVFLAAPVEGAEIEAAFAEQIETSDEVSWDDAAQAVRARRSVRLGALTLRQGPLDRPAPEALADALLEGLRGLGLGVLGWDAEAERLRDRLAFLRHFGGEPWPDVSDEALLAGLGEWLGPHVQGLRRLAEVQRVGLVRPLLGLVPYALHAELDRLAPSHLTVPSGSRLPLDYAEPEAPALAVRLQETFGMAETPRVLGGAVGVVMRLLSPAGRPVQVTRDLASFWASGYFDVRKDLRGRYPKHAWPDDPLTAEPTARARRRG